ncbi:MAG: hypothetical protein ACXWNC_00430 [Anaerolineales bacterium]
MFSIDQISLSQQSHQEINAGLPLGALYLPFNEAAFPLSHGYLQLGIAENGLPIVVDLYDPAPGPLLVAGDGGSGKTAFLQSLTQCSDFQNPGEILFGVVTPFPEEWEELEVLSNCLGIWPAYHSAARRFLSQLVSWADVLPRTRQVVMVIVDGLDLMTANGFHDQHDFRWLLTYGPRRHVWPVVSINPGRLLDPDSWLENFKTRIFSRVKRPQTAHLLMPDPDIDLSELTHAGQFGLWRQDCWLKFRSPSVY